MKKIILALVSLFVIQNFVSAETVTVPAGTVIPFSYNIEVNSKKILPDDQIPITVVRDIYINNNLVFKKGAQGYLVVFDVKKVRTWHPTEYKKGGYIAIEDGMITDITGNMHNISYKEYQKGSDLGPIYTTTNLNHATLNTPYNYRTNNISMNEQGLSTTNSNGLKITGDNVIIQKGTRAKAVIDNEFKIDLKNEGI